MARWRRNVLESAGSATVVVDPRPLEFLSPVTLLEPSGAILDEVVRDEDEDEDEDSIEDAESAEVE